MMSIISYTDRPKKDPNIFTEIRKQIDLLEENAHWAEEIIDRLVSASSVTLSSYDSHLFIEELCKAEKN